MLSALAVAWEFFCRLFVFSSGGYQIFLVFRSSLWASFGRAWARLHFECMKRTNRYILSVGGGGGIILIQCVSVQHFVLVHFHLGVEHGPHLLRVPGSIPGWGVCVFFFSFLRKLQFPIFLSPFPFLFPFPWTLLAREHTEMNALLCVDPCVTQIRSVDVYLSLQTLREVREAALKREVEITEELAMKSEELCAAEKSRELLRLEVRDLKLALMSSDKELELAKSGASRDAVSSSAALAQTQAEVSDYHMSVYTCVCSCLHMCMCVHMWQCVDTCVCLVGDGITLVVVSIIFVSFRQYLSVTHAPVLL